MFVEIYGGREIGPGAGISALELRRAAVETAGCRERFDQREWLANGGGGNEPPWRLEVTARDMLSERRRRTAGPAHSPWRDAEAGQCGDLCGGGQSGIHGH